LSLHGARQTRQPEPRQHRSGADEKSAAPEIGIHSVGERLQYGIATFARQVAGEMVVLGDKPKSHASPLREHHDTSIRPHSVFHEKSK
jgi:hypothetical protein